MTKRVRQLLYVDLGWMCVKTEKLNTCFKKSFVSLTRVVYVIAPYLFWKTEQSIRGEKKK